MDGVAADHLAASARDDGAQLVEGLAHVDGIGAVDGGLLAIDSRHFLQPPSPSWPLTGEDEAVGPAANDDELSLGEGLHVDLGDRAGNSRYTSRAQLLGDQLTGELGVAGETFVDDDSFHVTRLTDASVFEATWGRPRTPSQHEPASLGAMNYIVDITYCVP